MVEASKDAKWSRGGCTESLSKGEGTKVDYLAWSQIMTMNPSVLRWKAKFVWPGAEKTQDEEN